MNVFLEAQIPIASLCPCSQAISDYGAHNQRGIVHIEITPSLDENGEIALIRFEELIAIAEANASSPL